VSIQRAKVTQSSSGTVRNGRTHARKVCKENTQRKQEKIATDAADTSDATDRSSVYRCTASVAVVELDGNSSLPGRLDLTPEASRLVDKQLSGRREFVCKYRLFQAYDGTNVHGTAIDVKPAHSANTSSITTVSCIPSREKISPRNLIVSALSYLRIKSIKFSIISTTLL